VTPENLEHQVAILRIAERYFGSLVLFAMHQSGVTRALAEGPATLEEIVERVGGDRRVLRATLDAGVALDILKIEVGRYAAPASVRETLGRADAPSYVGELLDFLHSLVVPLSRLSESIRTGRQTASLFEGSGPDDAPAQRMMAAMTAVARSQAHEVVHRLDLTGARRLLDLGCGTGSYALALLEAYPALHATLLDAAGPIATARRLVAERGLTDRVEFVVADALRYTPSELSDVILVSNILHMIGPEESARLVDRCASMLVPGGRLVIQAQFLNDDRVSPRWPALLNLVEVVATPHGRNHTVRETRLWMEAAGFTGIAYLPLSVWNPASLLIGWRPKAPGIR
jgi:precorrin-6B methylase 2